MKKIIFLLAVLTAFRLPAEFRFEQFKVGKTNCIRVENKYYSITVVPDYGGRIFQWKNKISGVMLTDDKIPEEPGSQDSLGGILGDRQFGTVPYSFFVFSPDGVNGKTVTIFLKGENLARGSIGGDIDKGGKLALERRMTFRADSPVINVWYKYTNSTQSSFVGFALGQRSFFKVNGGKITPSEIYLFPSTHAVRHITGFTMQGKGSENPGSFNTALGAGWHGLLSPPIKSGIAIHHNDSWFKGRYLWKGGIDFPTYEWLYGELPAGYSQVTTFDLIQVDGFDSLSYASRQLLTDLRLEPAGKKLNVKLKIRRMEEFPAGAVLSTVIRKEASKWKYAARGVPFKGDEFTQKLPLGGNGAYAVEQRIMLKKKVLVSWYETIVIGPDAELVPMFKAQYNENHDRELIPGWKAAPAPKLDFSKESLERKFAVLFPQNDEFKGECTGFDLQMMRNETESRELILHPFNPADRFTITCRPPKGIRIDIIPETIIRIDNTGKSNARFCKILIPKEIVSIDAPTSLWLNINTDAAETGKYTVQVEIRNQAGKTAKFEVRVEVLPTALPARRPIMLESEVNFPKPVLDDPALLDAWLTNLNSHGVDFLQLGTGTGFAPATPAAGVRKDEVGLLNTLTDAALARGLTRAKAARYSKNDPTDEERENWARLGKVLRYKGYQDKDIFVKIRDEQPPDQFPSMAETAKWLKAAGFRPFSTFAPLFSFPERLKILSPYFEFYQGGSCGPETIAARRKDGLLKPGDLVGDYTGYGNCWQTYTTMLNWGIRAAFLGHDFFHNHEYMRGGNYRIHYNIIRIGEDLRPQDSPAHEGLRDGMEFANIAALCRQWMNILSGKPEYEALVKDARTKYDQVFGGILRRKPVMFSGISDYRMEPATITDYRKAKPILLSILDDFRKATAGKDFGCVTWNQYVLRSPETIFAAEGPEADYFAKAFRKTFRVPDGKTSEGVKIVFRKGDADGLSYKIMPEKDRIVVEAPTEENLRKAADNWIRTMDSTGIWF